MRPSTSVIPGRSPRAGDRPRRGFARGALAVAAILLGGCGTTPGVNPAPALPADAAAPVVEAAPAHVTGYEEPSAMLDNFTVHVAAVDGVPVNSGRAGWNNAVALKPGPRRLTLAFTRGVFSARAEVPFVAVSDANYQARFATDARLFGRNSYCEFWLIDTATQESVTPRIRVPLIRTASPDTP